MAVREAVVNAASSYVRLRNMIRKLRHASPKLSAAKWRKKLQFAIRQADLPIARRVSGRLKKGGKLWGDARKDQDDMFLQLATATPGHFVVDALCGRQICSTSKRHRAFHASGQLPRKARRGGGQQCAATHVVHARAARGPPANK